MAENSQTINVKELLSYCDDLIGVLRDKRDFNLFTHVLDHSNTLRSTVNSDFNSSQIAVSDYQKKIDDCKLKIEAARSEAVADEVIDSLQKELDDEIKREQLLRDDLRVVVDEINELDLRRVSIEEQRQKQKKIEEEEEKDRRKLSLYASVTKIIPNLESQLIISGHIMERDKRVVEKFVFDSTKEDAFDICNKMWKMIDQ